jgi:hypothetical protein
MRWSLLTSFILAVSAAIVSAIVAEQTTVLNMMLWLPALMTSTQLVMTPNIWTVWISAIWMLTFAAVGGFSVGLFYVPAAFAMVGAAMIESRTSVVTRNQHGRSSYGAWMSFGIATVLTTVLLLYMLHTRSFRWSAYAFVIAPPLAASLPLWWKKPGSSAISATLIAACTLFPITIEVGVWYSLALVPMIYVAHKVQQQTR